MFGRLNHIAIAVPHLGDAIASYERMGAQVSNAQVLIDHGVTVAFVNVDNTKIELLHPLGDDSPISAFLAKNPSGGMHHMCFEVPDILVARERLRASGIRILGDGEPKIGAHGNPVLFAHPKDLSGVLVELEEVPAPD